MKLRLPRLAALFLASSALMFAAPVTWTFTGATFNDGGTASGSFVFEADNSPYGFGTYGQILSGTITTTNGSLSLGETYSLANQFIYSNGGTYRIYAYDYFPNNIDESIGIFLHAAPTDAGGTIAVDEFFERRDDNTFGQQNLFFVDSRGANAGSIVSGAAVGAPEPATFVLAGLALTVLGLKRKRRAHF